MINYNPDHIELLNLARMLTKYLTTPSKEDSDKPVEKYLQDICLKLTEVESTINLFAKMVRTGIATNDIRNFVIKQSKMKRISNSLDIKVLRSTMKSKLRDACAFANRLRQQRNRLKKSIMNKYRGNVSRGNSVIRLCVNRAKQHRLKCDKKNRMKYETCKNKQSAYTVLEGLPDGVMNIVSKVNVFNDRLKIVGWEQVGFTTLKESHNAGRLKLDGNTA